MKRIILFVPWLVLALLVWTVAPSWSWVEFWSLNSSRQIVPNYDINLGTHTISGSITGDSVKSNLIVPNTANTGRVGTSTNAFNSVTADTGIFSRLVAQSGKKITLGVGDTLWGLKYFKLGALTVDSATGAVGIDTANVNQGLNIKLGKSVTYFGSDGVNYGTAYGNAGYGVVYHTGSQAMRYLQVGAQEAGYLQVGSGGTQFSLIRTGVDSFKAIATADTIAGLTGIAADKRAQITPQGSTAWTACPAAVVKVETLIVTCAAADTAAARASGYFWEIK